MIYLYHVAKACTVENILNEGLIPCKTKGITTINPKPVVWLTDNPKFILETQCGTRWIEQHQPKVIAVDVSSFKEEIGAKISWATGKPVICPHEFWSKIPIPAEFCSLYIQI